MQRSLYLVLMFLFLGIIAVHFTAYQAFADDASTVKSGKSNSDNRQVEPAPAPEPAEATNLNSSKSNREIQPTPEPDAASKVKGSKSNTSE